MSGRPPGTVQGRAWGHGLDLADISLALAFYVITGLAAGGDRIR